MFVFLCVLAGAAAASFVRNGRIKPILRFLVMFIVCGSSFIYCMGFDIEFASDSRLRLEQWFVRNVDKNVPVVSLIKRPYCPQLEKYGFQYITNWKSPPLEKFEQMPQAFPEYVITVSYNYLISSDNYEFKDALFSHAWRYKRLEKFNGRCFGDVPVTFWNWPGYKTPGIITISPAMSVFQKQQ